MKYSIITPVYNREDCINRCLDSVVRNLNSGVEIEHIVVDDGSSDKTPEIVSEYAEKYSHIRFIRFPKNRGTNAARNAAIIAATGDFCIILDSDDFFLDSALIDIDGVVSGGGYKAYMFAPDDMLKYYEENPVISGRESVILEFRNFLRGDIGGDFIHCISTEILKRNLFDESLRVFEGVFFLKFFKEAQRMLFTHHVVVIRERSRKDSVTRTMIISSKEVVRNYYSESLFRYSWFKEDYVDMGELKALSSLINSLLYFSLLLQDRKVSERWLEVLGEMDLSVNKKNELLYKLKFGGVYLFILKCFFILKYRILKFNLS